MTCEENGCYVDIPAKPVPPAGKYLFFEAKHPDSHSDTSLGALSDQGSALDEKPFGLCSVSTDILAVQSTQEIPVADREKAITWSAERGGYLEPTGNASPKAKARSVYIVLGDVDLEYREIGDNDQFRSNTLIHDEDLKRLTTEYSSSAPRGPPRKVKVYVVGKVGRVRFPDQKGASYSKAQIVDIGKDHGTAHIDLAPSAEEERAYSEELRRWDSEVQSIARSYNVPLDRSNLDLKRGKLYIPESGVSLHPPIHRPPPEPHKTRMPHPKPRRERREIRHERPIL